MTLLNSADYIVNSARADTSVKDRITEDQCALPRLFCDKPGEKTEAMSAE